MKLLRIALVGFIVLALSGCAPSRAEALDNCIDLQLQILQRAEPDSTSADPDLAYKIVTEVCVDSYADDAGRFMELYG
jgi:hypothetical protein